MKDFFFLKVWAKNMPSKNMLPLNSFYEASLTLIAKLDKSITRKKKASISHTHRCKNLQQHISKSALASVTQ